MTILRTRNLFITIIILIAVFISPQSVSAIQSITGSIDNDLHLRYDHILGVNFKKYKTFTAAIPSYIGITGVTPVFTGSPTHKTTEKNEIVSVTANQKASTENVHFSYDVEPAFNTPVFAGYDLTMYIGPWLEKKNIISITYPSTLNFISSEPVNTQIGKVELNYPKNDNYGIISVNFLKNILPAGYTKEDVGIYTIVGTKADVALIKSAVKELGFLPEMFQRITGRPMSPNKLYIVVDNLSGKGDLYENSGGFLRDPNIIMLDKSALKDIYFPSLQKMIIHETAHAVMGSFIFGGEEKNTSWLDEGLAVFFQNYAGDNYLGEKDYFIEKDSRGRMQLWQDLDDRFTPITLRSEYQKKFSFELPSDEDDLESFYGHSGLIFYHYYKKVGDIGMQKFFNKLGSLRSSGSCGSCDSKKVINIMTKLSKLSKDEILYPYKTNMGNVLELLPIIKNDYTDAQINSILAK